MPSLFALIFSHLSHLTEKDQRNILNEVRILASFNHPNIISFEEAFIDPKTKSLW